MLELVQHDFFFQNFLYLFDQFVPAIYWREYTGTISEDAVPGGHDIEHKTTYIGQGFVKERGITPGVIYPGVQSIVVPSFGVKTLSTYVKVSFPRLNYFD